MTNLLRKVPGHFFCLKNQDDNVRYVTIPEILRFEKANFVECAVVKELINIFQEFLGKHFCGRMHSEKPIIQHLVSGVNTNPNTDFIFYNNSCFLSP